ncbi:MAG TPA: hypothetical protein VFG04_22355 [Planctomycetaceae bacterium]|jgi:hypothetical protein|nr:hypothetical protein [Planctomycetaceae bacterium]
MSVINQRVERLRGPDDFRKVFALATQTAVALIAVVVVSRRMSGALRGPVDPAVPCFVATLATLLSLAALALWRQATRTAPKKTWILGTAMAMAVLSPVALGAALWIVPSTFVGGYLAALAMTSLVCALAIEDAAADFRLTNRLRQSLFERESPSAVNGPAAPVRVAPVEVATPTSEGEATVGSLLEEDLEEDEDSEAVRDEESDADESIVQWMTRRRLPDGGEVVEGAVQIELNSAEKVGVAHLAFLPPLSCDPRAECHLLSNFDGRVRITTAKSYGLRIEARQSGDPTTATTINVAFTAEAPPAASHAAAA